MTGLDDAISLLNTKLEDRYLRALLAYPELAKSSIDAIDKEHFSTSIKGRIFDAIKSYWHAYAEIPSREMLKIKFEEMYGERELSAFNLRVKKLYDTEPPEFRWVLEKLGEHINGIRLHKALFVANEHLLKGNHSEAVACLVDSLKSANLSNTNSTDAMNLSRSDIINLATTDDLRCSSTGIIELDNFINGGFFRNELFVLMAPLNVGKSWFVVHSTIHALLHKKNVLYFTLEMGREKVMQRMLQNMSATAVPKHNDQKTREENFWNNDFSKLERKQVSTLLDVDKVWDALQYLNKCGGKLAIEEFPSGTARISDIQQKIAQYDLEFGKLPDLVIVDGLLDMAVSDSNNREFRHTIVDIVKEFRAMAREHNCAVVITHQANREGETAEVVGTSHTSEAIGVQRVADVSVSLNQNKEEQKMSMARLYVMRSRASEKWGMVKIHQNLGLGQFYLNGEVVNTDEKEEKQLPRRGQPTEPRPGASYAAKPRERPRGNNEAPMAMQRPGRTISE